MNKYLHGIHDVDGAELMAGKPGWITVTEAIGSDPNDHSGRDYTQWTSKGFTIIARLNNGYAPAGTIPDDAHYENFARRCGNFVAASPGITVAIIGNEPNHENERPNGEFITPMQYAKCFDLCYTQIKRKVPDVQVCCAGIAPWDNTTTYHQNSTGDWVLYYQQMLVAITKLDAICLHTYTHGSDPALVTDNSKMDPPFEDRFYNFRAYMDFINFTPERLWDLPIYITETDQVIPWANVESDWMREAYEEIDFFNHWSSRQKIYCLCIYRTSRDDKWSIADKAHVKENFRAIVRRGYQSPIYADSPPPPDTGTPPDIVEIPDLVDRNIDPELLQRGVKFEFAKPPKGTKYWRISNAVHLNEQEADAVGPDHHILGGVTIKGVETAEVPFKVTWPSGDTHVYSKRDEPNASYNYDYPMSASLNEYSIWVDDGKPSDKASGIGMGAHGNPGIHTSTWIDWELVVSEEIIPPIPPIDPPIEPTVPGTKLVHPLAGSVITQHFYQNPIDYAQFGMPGHNGTDLGGKPQETHVLSVANGIVAFSDFDPGYGNYVRVAHRQDDMMCYVMYCHLHSPGLKTGTPVAAGERVGLLGTTGNSTGVHLHIEVRLMEKDGTYKEKTPMTKGRVDPQTFFIERGMKL